MKNIVKIWRSSVAFLLFAFCFLILITSCSNELDEALYPVNNGSLQFVVSDFPAGAAPRAVGLQDTGKTAWENNDKIFVHLNSREYGNQAVTLTFKNGDWESDGGTLSYLKDENLTITAVYAPDCEIKSNNTIGLIDGKQYGMAEYIQAKTTISGKTLNISFENGRSYSRLRLATVSEATLTVKFDGFTPAGPNGTTAPESYSLTADDDGNAYLYGSVAKNGTVTATAKHEIYPAEGITKTIENRFKSEESVSGQSYVLGVKLGDIVDAKEAFIGAVALKDGSFVSNEKIAQMTPAQKDAAVGIVFWTVAETDPDGRIYPASLTDDKVMNADFPHCINGLIVSLKNLETMAWQGTTDMEYEDVYEEFQNTDLFNPSNIDKSEYVPISALGNSSSEVFNSVSGYNNTKILEAYNVDGEKPYVVKPIEALSSFAENNPAPFGSTGWYLPSAKELLMLCDKDVDVDKISNVKGTYNKELLYDILSNTNIGGDTFVDGYYWSSTEYFRYLATAINFTDGKGSAERKIQSYYIRFICAF